ncbi:MAG: hypothetical protein IT267_00700 [Saprospiraceae bacterium]|nr:hypothetical protein [Saprospiraceae bacterium]
MRNRFFDYIVIATIIIIVFNGCFSKFAMKSNDLTLLTDSLEIANCIHEFYRWYDHFTSDSSGIIDFVIESDSHYVLDRSKLKIYLDKLFASGFVNESFINQQDRMYHDCEILWRKEKLGEVPSCLDGDPIFCSQEWDLSFWTKSAIQLIRYNNDSASAIMSGISFGIPHIEKFELKLKKDRWKIAFIPCKLTGESIKP